VIKVNADGRVETFSADPRAQGATAVALIGAGENRKALILGTGGFSAGGSDEAVLLAVPAPG